MSEKSSVTSGLLWRKRELGGGEGLKSLLSTEGFGRFKVVELQLQKLLVLDQ